MANGIFLSHVRLRQPDRIYIKNKLAKLRLRFSDIEANTAIAYLHNEIEEVVDAYVKHDDTYDAVHMRKLLYDYIETLI